MPQCQRCGYGTDSERHYKCCVSRTETLTRDGGRINIVKIPEAPLPDEIETIKIRQGFLMWRK